MSRFARIIAAFLAVAVVATPQSTATAQGSEALTITIEPAVSSVVLGADLDLTISVTNGGSAITEPLVVHLDITDPGRSTSVDPEDWTSTLTKPIGTVAPGATATVEWTIQPISAGTFALYAVTLAPAADTTFVSNVAQVAVADQRSLNPRGILPVALGAPAIIGALLLIQMRMSRRYGR